MTDLERAVDRCRGAFMFFGDGYPEAAQLRQVPGVGPRLLVKGDGRVLRVGILGATGYTGAELLRGLLNHPEVEVAWVTSEREAGRPYDQVVPGFRGAFARTLVTMNDADLGAADLLFLALPAGEAHRRMEAFLQDGRSVIDLSADFRLPADQYATWYGQPHTAPHLVEEAVYGLPEWSAAGIAAARLVANPGCYPTASLLALLPFLHRGLVHPRRIIIDAKSGITGAGRRGDMGFSERAEGVSAYAVGGAHRHLPEITEVAGRLGGEPVTVSFTPHLMPMRRGILATIYAEPKGPLTTEEALSVLREAYRTAPFVTVREDLPSTRDVYGSNSCHITARVEAHTGHLVLVSVIDNLVKGAAGQAIQNMNLMFGWSETTGLTRVAVWP